MPNALQLFIAWPRFVHHDVVPITSVTFYLNGPNPVAASALPLSDSRAGSIFNRTLATGPSRAESMATPLTGKGASR